LNIHEAFLSGTRRALVLELADEDLFELVLREGGLSEFAARPLMSGLLEGIQHIHKAGIAHRDIKLENLLLKDGVVKISDFDLSVAVEAMPTPTADTLSYVTALQATPCGTFAYAAPEVAGDRDDGYFPYPVDLWSSGICLFAMFTCEFPFNEPNDSCPEFRDLLRGEFRWPKALSPHAVSLLSGMLSVHPERRFTVEDALQHPWCMTPSSTLRSGSVGSNVIEDLLAGPGPDWKL